MPSSTTAIGRQAEAVVASWLQNKHGHQIIAQNYRTRFYEIDIISQSPSGNYYFTEVKYRKNASRGNGLDAITPQKLGQMHFAAEIFTSDNNLKAPIRLAAASVMGANFQLKDFVIINE
ncbi:MAG: YraN family protein [Candidatus Nomurabacteria bacterium]|jgi:Holliday junction resolvase-like predicted endonuclease|nr:YraN family protein [Candidatus Nomurabacteria bacterium]